MTKREYRVTFGQRYRREPHPKFAAADPDGWIAIFAENESQARRVAFRELGQHWAFIYTYYPNITTKSIINDNVNIDWDKIFPAGELAQWRA